MDPSRSTDMTPCQSRVREEIKISEVADPELSSAPQPTARPGADRASPIGGRSDPNIHLPNPRWTFLLRRGAHSHATMDDLVLSPSGTSVGAGLAPAVRWLLTRPQPLAGALLARSGHLLLAPPPWFTSPAHRWLRPGRGRRSDS